MHRGDAAGVVLPGDVDKPRLAHHLREALLVRERLDGLRQVHKPCLVPGDEAAPKRDQVLQVEVVQRAPHRVRRRGELQAHQMPARLQHAEHLGERARAVGHVADAVCHGERVVARVRVGDVLRVDHLEIDGHAACGPVGVVRSCHVEHLVYQVGALDMARMLRARHREGDVPGASRDVEHVVGRLDGGLPHHSCEP